MKRLCYFSIFFLVSGCAHQAPIYRPQEKSFLQQPASNRKQNSKKKDQKKQVIQINCALKAAKK